MANTVRKKSLFSRIETREDALKTVRDAAIGFFVLAGLQGLAAFLLAPALLIDATLLLLLGGILMRWRSRTAAILLLLFSMLEGIVTLLNRLGLMSQGGTNVLLAVIMIIAAVRAVEATFKLHGRFAATMVGGAKAVRATVGRSPAPGSA